MADFPVSEISNAISKVISSVIPPRSYTFLIALLPGLFFGISILLANPALFCELVARAQDGFGLGHYAILGLALFLAFVVGNTFMLLVTLFQRLMGFLYRLWAYVWEELCAWPLLPLTNWLYKKPRWTRRRWLNNLSLYIQQRRSGVPSDEDARKCWALIAKRLLKVKYGIEPQDVGQDEWNALYWTLGTLTLADVRGSITMVVFEATGWCGLAATLFAHALRNRYYVAFSMLLIVGGLLHDWYVAEGLNNFRFLGFLKIRALLREFGNATERGERSPLTTSKSAAGPGSAAEGDEI
jgi:hypothetical protein